ncbi:YqzH family protein [Bacillus taeanensis]|uniref:YqzH-like protein n=1 Tax=Bacillus taeanensis TaxID=273032 RepID=A0A366Y020_9BACI|nr:YqzH family protein [Bacillus taeanensis]RBW70389.1 hypothetical protein DS031_07440 [Bacillus taeanensis]
MNKSLIKKMLINCLTDYFGAPEAIPLTAIEYDLLIDKIKTQYTHANKEALYIIIQDVVYDYITK